MRKNNVNLSIIKLRSIIKHATAINTPKISTERKKDQERFQFGPFPFSFQTHIVTIHVLY